jgi:glycine cleavage system protein P-like pyridoxal-binding family
MAGMTIIVIKQWKTGNIDVEDVREKALKIQRQLSCFSSFYFYTWCI